MKSNSKKSKRLCKLAVLFFVSMSCSAQQQLPSDFSFTTVAVPAILVLVVLVFMIKTAFSLKENASELYELTSEVNKETNGNTSQFDTEKLSSQQIARILLSRGKRDIKTMLILMLGSSLLFSTNAAAQSVNPQRNSLVGEPGIIITLFLITLPILLAMLLLLVKLRSIVGQHKKSVKIKEAERLAEYLDHLSDEDLKILEKRKAALDYHLSNLELSGEQPAEDKRGMLHLNRTAGLPAVSAKKKMLPGQQVDPLFAKLILWYIGTATFWLIFGTTAGEYLGIKFIAPDADHISWLSFGRLRPVHTNAVFWGWASLGMIGLGYYIVHRVGNGPIASLKLGWYSLIFINAAILLGSLSLMAGINNGGGEYREYIWPVMLLFALGLAFTLKNFLSTIAQRRTQEIYISNWYIVSAIIFIMVVALVGYLPMWQDGLGETIVQGYYMHQAVGMWFMFFTLGIVYYFLPQQLNKPIYSYSLGILAFWTQIFFYTLIGTHHFVFSAIPWWLQTVAIVASVGMIIPVVAGTTNFVMTFRGSWNKIGHSYTLPFFLVGTLFYFTGSLQGTAEAFRFTNLLWHFTDFTIAHSHMTMYGIITFFLWAGIYAVIPRITGREASQIAVGAHFWLALIGLLFYIIPLMYGGTLRGLSWMDGKPFIDSVTLMMPFWLWRAIGGTLMWISHILFAVNFYTMVKSAARTINVEDTAIQKLEGFQVINESL